MKPAVMKAMREYTVKLMGRDVDLLTMHRGFSYMMGIMLIAFGAINALLVIVHPELPFETKPLLWLNIAVSAVGLFMSYKYFFLAPIALTAISTLCFSGACFLMM